MPNKRPSSTVSIRDVTQLAGVSVGSASRVINKVQNVTADTRDRVLQAIAQLGYRPNHAARSLRLRSTRTIGCMLTDVTNPLYGQFFHAVEERLRKAGYVVLVANSLNNPEREIDILATFKERGMDGVVIAPGNERHQGVLRVVLDVGVPTVIIDRDMAPERGRVQFDHARSMRAMAGYLAEQGHRRVALALVLAQASSRPMRRRIEGFRAGLRDHGLDLEDELLIRMPSSMSSSFKEVSALLGGRQRPTAIAALGTHILNETLSAIAASGLRIPQDISVVSIGDPDFARNFTPPLSSVSIDLDQAADAAIRLLLGRIEHGDELPAQSVRVPIHFIERQSCGPAPR